MSDPIAPYHISSAVVFANPHVEESVLTELGDIGNVEVFAHQDGKIVVTIEGTSTGMLGEILARISLIEGVVAANMVFEHVENGGDDRL